MKVSFHSILSQVFQNQPPACFQTPHLTPSKPFTDTSLGLVTTWLAGCLLTYLKWKIFHKRTLTTERSNRGLSFLFPMHRFFGIIVLLSLLSVNTCHSIGTGPAYCPAMVMWYDSRGWTCFHSPVAQRGEDGAVTGDSVFSRWGSVDGAGRTFQTNTDWVLTLSGPRVWPPRSHVPEMFWGNRLPTGL